MVSNFISKSFEGKYICKTYMAELAIGVISAGLETKFFVVLVLIVVPTIL